MQNKNNPIVCGLLIKTNSDLTEGNGYWYAIGCTTNPLTAIRFARGRGVMRGDAFVVKANFHHDEANGVGYEIGGDTAIPFITPNKKEEAAYLAALKKATKINKN